MSKLPKNAQCYKTTHIFTPQNLPSKFKNKHHTKAGVWGEIKMLSGKLALKRFDNSANQHCTGCEELVSPETAVFAPQELHSVSFIIEGSFTVSFYKTDLDRPEETATTT